MGSIRQFAGQTIIYGVGSILPKLVFWFLVTVVLTRILGGEGTHEFGIYGEMYAYVSVFIVIFSLKLDTALFRYGNSSGDFQSAFYTSISIVIISALILIVTGLWFAKPIAQLLGEVYKPYYIKWFAFIIAFDIMALIPYAALRIKNRAKLFAGLKVFNALFSGLLIIFFLFLVPKLGLKFSWIPQFEYKIDYVFLTNLIASALIFFILILKAPSFKFQIDPSLFSRYVPYIIPLIIVGICNNFIQYGGAALIKYFINIGDTIENLSASGIFDSSRRLAILFAIFVGAYNYAAEPFFFNNSSDVDKENYYGKICKLFVLIGSLAILSIVFSIDLIALFVDEAYRESVFIIPVLLMAYLFLGIYHNISIWYKLSDNTRFGAYISICGLLVTIVLSVVFLEKYGYVVVAWANLLSYVLMVYLAYILGQQKHPISYPVAGIVQCIFILSIILLFNSWIDTRWSISTKYSMRIIIFAAFGYYIYKSEEETFRNLIFKRG